MPKGPVAAVSKVISDREILLDHANWSRPGKIEHGVLAIDTSDAGDWSEVRVWYGPSRSLGARTNPTSGFIYNHTPVLLPAMIAEARDELPTGKMVGHEG